MTKYGKNDASRDTGASPSEVSQAWHSARDDASSEGSLNERNWEKVSDSQEGSAIYSFIQGTINPFKK